MKSTLLASSLAVAGLCAVPAFADDAVPAAEPETGAAVEFGLDFQSAYVATGATCNDGWVAQPWVWVGDLKAGDTAIPLSFDFWGCMDLEKVNGDENSRKGRFEEIDLDVMLDLGALWTPDENFCWEIGYLEYDYPGHDWKADNLIKFDMKYKCFLNPKFVAKYRIGGDSKGKLEAALEISEGATLVKGTKIGDIGVAFVADIWYVNNDDVDDSDLDSGLACADFTAKLTAGHAYVGCTYVAQIDDDVLTDDAYDVEWIASFGASYAF
ncbi:MAG: hypothetical protein IJL06_07480 [Kiritimatiellae bacterium]|nr:hypothetical protein [Kiritimatiellia bacterium]